jgi:hypothetical protein
MRDTSPIAGPLHRTQALRELTDEAAAIAACLHGQLLLRDLVQFPLISGRTSPEPHGLVLRNDIS